MVAGRAMAMQMVQMMIKTNMTTSLVVLGERGFMIALLLSRVMASMVNTLAGTVEREMNWLTEQYTDPKYQILQRTRVDKILEHKSVLPVPHVDEGEDAVERGHYDVRYGQVHKEIVCHTPHAPVSWNFHDLKLNLSEVKKHAEVLT